jgi:hypothetical protein
MDDVNCFNIDTQHRHRFKIGAQRSHRFNIDTQHRHRFNIDTKHRHRFNKDTRPMVLTKWRFFCPKTRFFNQTHNLAPEQENNHPPALFLLKSTPNSL